MEDEVLIEVKNLKKYFPVSRGILAPLFTSGTGGFIKAVDGVNFKLEKKKVFGLAGESGCGKTTIAMLLTKIYNPTEGDIFFKNFRITNIHGGDLKKFRQKCQMVHQDPYESSNPQFTISKSVMESLNALGLGNKKERKDIASEMLSSVNLNPEQYWDKYPHEVSGGELQRVNIAAALASKPELLIGDEPTSMLDVSIKAEIITLIRSLVEKKGLAFLYISHDLAILSQVSDIIAIMYLGKIVEIGAPKDVIGNPLHPYTKALINAIPVPDPRFSSRIVALKGDITSAISIPENQCRFFERCPYAIEKCGQERPPDIVGDSETHQASCFKAISP